MYNTNLHIKSFEQIACVENIAGGLLAPRGVFLHKNILVVSDTGNNRVLVWKHWHVNAVSQPDLILGGQQAGMANKKTVSAASLQYPSGIWTNGEMLMVADAWNHRVLIWKSFPGNDAQPADVVIGQPDCYSNEPNVAGIGKAPSANSLYWPYGLYCDGKSVWISDTGNRRILFFESVPEKDFAPATAVIGQPDFTSRDYDSQQAVWPYSVKINNAGGMLVADTQYYRVLYWKHWSDALKTRPALIFGQPHLDSNGQNQFRLKPSAETLNWCYDACFIENGVAIADTGNSRILLWDDMPIVNAQPAVGLIGQKHFEVVGESSLSMKFNTTNEMYWPFAVNNHEDILVVADTGNHRILFYKR